MRFAVVGNRHGHVFGMVRQVLAHPDCEIAAVAEDRPECLAELTALGDFSAYHDYRRMLDVEEVDAIILVTANNEKADAIEEAVNRGLHVLVDKPVVTSIEGLSRVEQALARNSRVIYPWFTMRFTSIYRAASRVVSDGLVGRVINCYVQNPHKMQLADRKPWELDDTMNGGAIVDLGCHSVDLVRWFSGKEVVEVTAHHANLKFPQIPNFQDHGAILLKLEDGSSALLRTDWLSALGAADFMDYLMIVAGDDGALEVRDGLDKHVRFATDSDDFRLVDPVEPPHGMIQDFLNNVRGDSPTLLTTKDAIEATRVTLYARQSADEGRTLRIP